MSLKDKFGSIRYEGALAFEIVSQDEAATVAVMDVTPTMLNPFGTIHAGAMIWFADVTATVCAIGGAEVGADGKGFPLAVDLHTVLLSNVREGRVTATAKPVRRGRKLTVIRTEVTDAAGRLLIDVTTTHVPAG